MTDFDLENQEEKSDIPDYYRELFLKNIGPIVLRDILFKCHHGKDLDPNNPIEIAEYNTGLRILRKCCLGEGNYFKVLSILASSKE